MAIRELSIGQVEVRAVPSGDTAFHEVVHELLKQLEMGSGPAHASSKRCFAAGTQAPRFTSRTRCPSLAPPRSGMPIATAGSRPPASGASEPRPRHRAGRDRLPCVPVNPQEGDTVAKAKKGKGKKG
jgi:hypothetical protein